METIASRALRNHTRRVLERVAAGETFTVTLDGRPVARLVPVAHRRRWIARDVLFRHLPAIQADAGLAAELKALAPDTTDDLGPL